MESNSKSVAIIGMSGVFPDAPTLEAFYQNLRSGKDSIRELSKSRMNHSYVDPNGNYLVTAHMDRVDLFDHKYFDLSKKEADLMDPEQRLALELACQTIESAGYSLQSFDGSNTAVILGSRPSSDYRSLIEDFDAVAMTGNLSAVNAGRISYHLNLNGPAFMVDTTCSSALTAIHEASQKVLSGEVDYALTGGTFVIVKFPEIGNNISQVGILSPDGRSKTFDADANGTGGGEGGGMVLLKRLDKAIEDGDHIHAVIKGGAVNHDGKRSTGLTAPSPSAQSEVLIKAWRNADVDPESISYIEAHGTGTKLGDPIEFQGITDAFREFTDKTSFCAVGSVKTNIGHLNNAAGIAGLIKCVLSLEHGELMPSLHFNNPNPYIDFERSAAYVNDELRTWEANGIPRKCGLSSFGLSGTNTHIVLEEKPEFNSVESTFLNHEHLLKISAKSDTACIEYLGKIKDFIASSEKPLSDILATLNAGKDDYGYRLAFSEDNKERLLEQLNSTYQQLTDKQQKLEKISITNIILLFSSTPVTQEVVERLSENYSPFKTKYDELTGIIAKGDLTKETQTFIFQLALYEQIKSLGLSPKSIIGSGIGKVTKQVLVDGLSFEKGVVAIKQGDIVSQPLDEKKYLNAVKNITSTQSVIFVEVGSKGVLSEKLLDWQNELPEAEVISLIEKNDSMLLNKVAHLYEAGVTVNWNSLYPTGTYNKVIAPTYPFERVSCWVKPTIAPTSSTANVNDWCYETGWIATSRKDARKAVEHKVLIIVQDQNGLGEELYNKLSIKNQCIKVRSGDGYQKIGDSEFEVNLTSAQDIEALKNTFQQEFGRLDGIIDTTHYGVSIPLSPSNIEEQLQDSIEQRFWLFKSFSSYFKKNFLLGVITSGAFEVMGNEQVSPIKNLPIAMVKGLMAEYPMLDVHCIDLEFSTEDLIKGQSELVLKELEGNDTVRFAAYRGTQCYVQAINPVLKKENEKSSGVDWKENGTYLITGGAIGIGFEVSKMLASQYQANLILLGRTPLNSGSKVSKETGHGQEIQKNIDSLNKLGAKVTYHSVDISNYKALEVVVDRIAEGIENIHGVIHAAGVPGNWESLENKEINDFRSTLLPKVHGTVYLDNVLQKFAPDFFIAFSSLNAVVAQRNSIDYAVANTFEDAYAKYDGRKTKNFLAINWPGWYETGMSFRAGAAQTTSNQFVKPLSNTQGLLALHRALELNRPNLLIGSVNLELFKVNPFFLVRGVELAENKSVMMDDKKSSAQSNEVLTPVQSTIKSIWTEVLNEEHIALEDDFFDIGGHSLNGMQVINRVHEELNVSVEMDDLFDYGTLKEFAEFIEEQRSVGKVTNYQTITKAKDQEYYDLSHAQRRLWVLNQFDKETNTYNMPLAYVLEGLQTEAFEKAVNALIERHESFRTSFVVINGEPKQAITDFQDISFKIEFVDAEGLDEEAVKQLINEESGKPFDLERGNLIRAKLIHLEADKYVLVFTVHHIISDGWSMRLIVSELVGLYNAFLEDRPNPLPALNIQYKDFACWQNEQLSAENVSVSRNYWMDQLKGDLPTLELPTDYPRPAVRTFEGDMHSVVIPQEIIDKLTDFNARFGTSLYMNLLTVLYTLLYRYTGQNDIIIGSPILGRTHKDLESIIGFFLNNLSLRLQIEDADTFESVLVKVKKLTLGAYEHQDYPFDSLVDDLKLQVDRSRHPIFDVVLTENVDLEGNNEIKMTGVKIDDFDTGFRSNMVDLRIVFSNVKDGVSLNFDYNKHLFTSRRIENMAIHFIHMLKALVSQENDSIAKIDYLPKAEKKHLISGIGYKPMDYPKDKTLQELFEEQVEKTPENIAVVSFDDSLTYQQLNESANQLAHYLIETYSTKKDQVIGLMLDRSEFVPIGMLGILKSGAAFLPIDTKLPASRKEMLLSEAGVNILLTDSENMLGLESYQGELLALDIQLDVLTTPKDNPTNVGNNSSDLAYIIYTSGSTGKPKGVMVEHKSSVNIMLDHIDQLEITPADNILQFASISFDVSICESFMAFLSGASLVLTNNHLINNHVELLTYMEQKQVSIGVFTASVYHALDLERLEKIRAFIIGGEAPDPTKIIQGSKHSTMLNAYGPTECSICITTHKVSEADREKGAIPIGKPIANTKLYVLDKNRQIVPLGIKGEIYAAGAGLSRGYLNDQKLTEEKFIANPYSPAEKLYKTGDEGQWSYSEELQILGRTDQQVKVRGHRIELGEIEKSLVTYPSITNAGVIAKSIDGDNQLLAYYVSDEPQGSDQLSAFLGNLLPSYMVPSHFTFLEELPLTTNGKLDTKRLLSLAEKTHVQKEYVAPQTELEQQLAVIWGEVLGSKVIGLNDNFFEMGGHSLKATQLTSRIVEALKVNLDVGDIFSNPTIAELSNLLESIESDTVENIETLPEREYYEVSHAQKRLWILNQFEENNTVYNLPVAYQFDGELNTEALVGALQDIVERHEVLRTTFALVDEQLMQKIHQLEDFDFKVEIIDLKQYSDLGNYVKKVVSQEMEVPFDLETGPLFRAKLLQLGEESHCLIFVIHHIIADAWSLNVLIQEITSFYNVRAEGKVHELNPLRVQYKEYSAWQNKQLVGDGLRPYQEYWHEKFKGELPILDLPTDFQRQAVQTHDGNHIKHVLNLDITKALRQFSQDRQSSVFIMLLSVFKTLFYKYTGQEDIIIGTPVAGRNHSHLEDQVGFYVNTLAIRTQLNGKENFEQIMNSVKNNLLEAQKHQLYPFDKLIEDLDLARDTSRAPLFNVMIDMQVDEEINSTLNLQALTVTQVEVPYEVSKFDLSITFVDTGENIAIGIEYNTSLYREETVRRMFVHYENLLNGILSDSEQMLEDLTFISSEEQQQLDKWSEPIVTRFEKSKTLHQLFEQTVEKFPNNTALVFQDQVLTYEQLDTKANQLANYLVNNYDIQPGDMVGILMDRSEKMIIAILAVLKTGAAYLAVDVQYPAQRVTDIYEDSEARLFITHDGLENKLPEVARVVNMDKELEALEVTSAKSLSLGTTDHHAYCIYTSGSTGKPKGTTIRHSSIVNYVQWANKYYFNDQQGHIFPLFTSLSFDLTLTSIFTTLLRGDSLIVCKEDNVTDTLQRICSDEQINTIKLTPSHIDLLKELEIQKTNWSTVIIGGEALSNVHIDTILGLAREVSIYNEYGPTEATVGCTVKKIKASQPITIGKAVDNVSIYILDANLNPTPIGIDGELYIGGEGLATGYLKRPELTSQKFIDHPINSNERLYRTGDIARWTTDGEVKFVGRADDQIKVRGYRIEPGEIEQSLLAYDEIEQAVVMAKAGMDDKSNYLVAFVTHKSEEEFNSEEYKSALNNKLPDHMIPSFIIPVDEIPLTINGKTDFRALESLQIPQRTNGQYVAPTTEMQKELLEIWRDVLQLDQIGIHDNFFHMGGHSLKAVQATTRISNKMDAKLSLSILFRRPTIAQLATELEALQWVNKSRDEDLEPYYEEVEL